MLPLGFQGSHIAALFLLSWLAQRQVAHLRRVSLRPRLQHLSR